MDISSFDSETINSAVEQMSREDLWRILSSLSEGDEVETLIKCDQKSLDKIFSVKSENVEESIKGDYSEECLDVVQFVEQLQKTLRDRDEGTLHESSEITPDKIEEKIKWMISKLEEDNKRCEGDITDLKNILDTMEKNFYRYEDELEDEDKKICREKMENTSGLIRLRTKTLENNREIIEGLKEMSKN